ncbi:MAG: TolC family protein, partial [Phaeodactylibacter sp.]|nr:TolC family protein [Phaeodactylibacter sp.]
MMRISAVLFLFLVVAGPAVGQGVLDEDKYFELVLQNHPKSLQSALYNEQADFALRAAKGAFDPVLAADWATKQFDGKQYYSIGNSGLKVPTRFVLAFQAGFLWSDGVYLNPQRTLPDAGQALLGAELPLLNGLFTDAKRTDLR